MGKGELIIRSENTSRASSSTTREATCLSEIMREGRPAFVSNDFARGTDTEARAALEGYVAYFGTYTMDSAKNTVVHHIDGALFPNFVGGDQVRNYKFENGRLVLSTPPILWRGEPQEFVLVWERLL